jgi:hypothetical protein
MKTSVLIPVLLLTAVAAAPLAAQTSPVQLPSLSIANAQIVSTVSYDAQRGVYRYDYSVVNPPTNKAAIRGVRVDVTGKTPHSQIDPTLQNNIPRGETAGKQLQPDTTIPVGITVPDPVRWLAMVNPAGQVAVAPGKSTVNFALPSNVGGIVIESRFPPALREVSLIPNDSAWFEFAKAYPEDTAFTPDSIEAYKFKTTALAPFEPADTDLYDGGGQQPAEVNKFLRYAAPNDNRIKLAPGTTSVLVIVYYGATIIPATFSATLNGLNITSRFHPIPGTAEAQMIAVSGTTKLHLSVDGTKASGGRGTDSDTLTFLP